MTRRCNFLPVIFLLSSFITYGQYKTNFELHGIIIDTETNISIKNVNIKIAGQPKGTITDNEGNFTVVLSNVPTTLIISHVSYNTSFHKIVDIETNNITVKLERKIELLKEVIVEKTKIEELIKDEPFFIYDFEIFEDKILFVAFEERKLSNAKLLLTNEKGDIIAKTSIKKPERLYKDCFGTHHLMTKDTAYQIYFDSEKLLLLYPSDPDQFMELMLPCVAGLNDKIYFKEYTYNDQVLMYYYIDVNTKEKVIIAYISDKVGINILNDLNRHKKFMTGNDYTEFDERFDKMVFFNPVHAPLVRLNEQIIIFNYISSVIEFRDSAAFITKNIPINYHLDKNWKEEIYIDEYFQKTYIKYEINGITFLSEINLSTGKVERKIEIPHFTYVHKIRIHKNKVYFLYSDRKDTEMRKIYVMDI